MPIMDGITMLEKSINDFVYSAIIISGYDEFEYAKRSIKIGVAEYLLKPVNPEQLVEALERAKEQVKQRKQFELIKNNTISIGYCQYVC
jgi:two-component system response regulator YesN